VNLKTNSKNLIATLTLLALPISSVEAATLNNVQQNIDPVTELKIGLGIVENFPQIKTAVENFLTDIGVTIPQNRTLNESDFINFKAIGFAITCADSVCTQQVRKSNNADINFDLNKSKKGRYGSIAQVSGTLVQTTGNNDLCINEEYLDETTPANRAKCKSKVEAANRSGDIFVAKTNASYFGFVYDGENGTLLQAGDEDSGEIYKSSKPTFTPEPASILSLLTLGTLGAGSTLLRKQKQKKSISKAS
jgi:hypothetical protein